MEDDYGSPAAPRCPDTGRMSSMPGGRLLYFFAVSSSSFVGLLLTL
jgi:hypothetical protein